MPEIYRYPLDPTGVSPGNLVVDEEHQLSNRTVRCVAPTYGGFYAEGVIVKDFDTDIPLIKGDDYFFGELFEFPTGRYGKEVWGMLVIKKTSVTKIKITYQALGGDYSYSMDAIVAMMENLDLGDRPVAWPDILGRPALFEPASHLHDIGDVYGFEYVVHSIERLRTAILTGDTASHDEIYRYIDAWGDSFNDSLDDLTAIVQGHIVRNDNPHSVTKEQVGLSDVENYGIASKQEAEEGTVSNKYMTPSRTAQAIYAQSLVPLNAHVSNLDNPHGVTKAQVGLGSVQNYGVATRQEAEEGSVNNKYMTPLRVKEAIAVQAIEPLNEHIARIDNPHATTKAQVGLGSVENYGVATEQEAKDGAVDDKYMTPLRVRDAIFEMALTDTDFQTTTQAPMFLANPGGPSNAGYSFRGVGAFDTGMFSLNDGDLRLLSNGVSVLSTSGTDARLNHSKPLTSTHMPLAMVTDYSNPNVGSMVTRGQGAGDANLTGITFYHDNYQIRMGLRADGYFGIGGGSRSAWSLYTDNNGNLTAAGDVVAYSDPRLKENFSIIENAVDTVRMIGGYSFNWKHGIEHTANKAGKRDYGFNAVEINEILPELVHTSVDIDGEQYLTVAYEKFAPFFARAITELNDKLYSQSLEILRLNNVISDVRSNLSRASFNTKF